MKHPKIIVTEKIFRDGENPICFDCQKPAIALQIYCNCGCDEAWCQPCFLKHYRDSAIQVSIQRFTECESDLEQDFAEALNER